MGCSVISRKATRFFRSGRTVDIPCRPQPRQHDLLRFAGLDDVIDGGQPKPPLARCIGFGGEPGGGKTSGALILATVWALAYPASATTYFRRTYTDLEKSDGAIAQSMKMLKHWCSWNGTKRLWRLPNGSTIKFEQCQHRKDVYNHHSSASDLMIIDEATEWYWSMVDYLLTRNRPTAEIFAPLAVFCTNPSNVGHAWFRSMFVKAGPPDTPVDVKMPSGAMEAHIYLPSKLADNPILDKRADGAYRKDLDKRDAETRKRLFDWDHNAGEFLPEFVPDPAAAFTHVIRPFEIPAHWPAWCSHDYGLANPMSCHTYRQAPNGRIYVTHEVYGAEMLVPEQARRIAAILPNSGLARLRLISGGDIWTRSGEERNGDAHCNANTFRDAGILFSRGVSDRLNGVARVREMLAVMTDGETADGRPQVVDGLPRLQYFSTCIHAIRTLQDLVHSETNPDDVDASCEDHHLEELMRFALDWHETRVQDPINEARELASITPAGEIAGQIAAWQSKHHPATVPDRITIMVD